MVRRVKAKSVLMAQLFDDLSEGLFQIADFAAEITTGGNLRQAPQKIHRFFISFLDAARSALLAPVSILTLWRIGKLWRRCEGSIAPAHPQSSFLTSSRPAPPAARGLPVAVQPRGQGSVKYRVDQCICFRRAFHQRLFIDLAAVIFAVGQQYDGFAPFDRYEFFFHY